MKHLLIFILLTLALCQLPVMALECPQDMVDFEQFCMDRYEAPNIQGERPFVAQTATDGEEWCLSKKKRLCRENEWLMACEGDEGRAYAYGNQWQSGTCNDEKTWRAPNWSKIQQYPGPIGRQEVARLDQAEPSGSFPNCVSPEGVYDLGGNVAEWVSKTEFHTSQWEHVMMGCYWSGCYAQFRASKRSICRGSNAGHPGRRGLFRTYEAGFRCCLSKYRP